MKRLKAVRVRILKEVFDRCAAAFTLAVLTPVFLLVAALLKMEALMNPDYRGPVFYKETRISRGKRFKIYKFRTVRYETLKLLKKSSQSITEFTAHHTKKKYLTPVGMFLAQRYLDELPQLFNVARGDMSLVGPRPHVPDHYQNDLKAGIVSAKYIKAGAMGIVQSSKGNPALRHAFARMATKHYTTNKMMILVDRLYFQKYLKSSALGLLFYDIWVIVRCVFVIVEAKGF
jgi:lipopolysaccharide/colanic/teichoic acid biosynthesis glycosyltransferase